jgi:BON domain-containing protein
LKGRLRRRLTDRERIMGLISFVKNVGASIFGGSEAKAAPAEELKKELDKHGLDASNVKIEVEGDKVKVSGATSTTEQAEKIAVALGNTVGVGTVQNDIKPAKTASYFAPFPLPYWDSAIAHSVSPVLTV